MWGGGYSLVQTALAEEAKTSTLYSVDGTGYSDWYSAKAAALKTKGTIKLEADLTLDYPLVISAGAGNEFTFDLNGHTISEAADWKGEKVALVVKSGNAKVTITDSQGIGAIKANDI